MKVNYEEAYKERLEKNRASVINSIGSKEMDNKINNRADKFNSSYTVEVERIKAYPFYADTYIKEPSKQNIYEKIAGKYLSSFGIAHLPATGRRALYVSPEGKIISKRPQKDIKSIDFYGNIKNKNLYISHKYTKEPKGGGGQNEQRDDIIKFLSCSKNNTEENNIFLLYLMDITMIPELNH
jgi:hypothetical protein